MKTKIISAIKGVIIPRTICKSVNPAAAASSLSPVSASRAYLRALRQAELQSWQRSGGDVLNSRARIS